MNPHPDLPVIGDVLKRLGTIPRMRRYLKNNHWCTKSEQTHIIRLLAKKNCLVAQMEERLPEEEEVEESNPSEATKEINNEDTSNP